MYRGSLIGHPVENLRVVLTDGASHAVDSSELAFKLAAIYAFRQVLLVTLFLLKFIVELMVAHVFLSWNFSFLSHDTFVFPSNY